MGGSAIKSIIGREADRISLDQKNFYISLFNNYYTFLPVREIKSKIDFGDIDILTDTPYERVKDQFENILVKANIGITGKSRNSEIVSYAINNSHQLDLIYVENKKLAFEYYSDNDRGMILGNIFHHLGFSYGHKGLYLKLEDSKFFLSDNTYDILNFIGYSSKNIIKIIDPSNGFDTYEDMFEWILLCPFFNKKYFLWESLNNENRTRNRKRKTWNSFVSYIEHRDNSFPEVDREHIKTEALSFFKKELEYMEMKRNIESDRSKKRLINGELISKVTGLKNKELGDFIIQFKSYMESRLNQNNLKNYLQYQYELKDIEITITEFYKKYKTKELNYEKTGNS